MADNLDDLLDEVEAKFCRNTSLPAQLPCNKQNQEHVIQRRNNHSTHRSNTNQQEDKDIEAVLQEILDDDEDDDLSSEIPAATKSLAKDSCPQTASKKTEHCWVPLPSVWGHPCGHPPLIVSCEIWQKERLSVGVTSLCCPVFLGGSSISSGVGTSISQRVCDQLRCTSCDFRVAMFDDHEWDPSCDYLFFRNNMPDHNKLKVKLKRRQGARAYACQCSWHSSFTLSELRHIPQLKWVCGQHRA